MEFIFGIGVSKGLHIYLVVTSFIENSFLLFWIVHIFGTLNSYTWVVCAYHVFVVPEVPWLLPWYQLLYSVFTMKSYYFDF